MCDTNNASAVTLEQMNVISAKKCIKKHPITQSHHCHGKRP